jgi:hypothetical protein
MIQLVAALLALAGALVKIYLQRDAAKKLAVELDTWKKLAASAVSENTKLRQLVANKEVALAAAKAELANRLSAGELADALTGLFRHAGSVPGAAPAGDHLATPGAAKP